MRTKTLLLTAALTAAGIATSMAQVYSVNAVGYVNKTIKPGLQILNNPLSNGDNLLSTVIPPASVPAGTQIVKYSQMGGYSTITREIDEFGGQWDANPSLNPGEGFFVRHGNPGDFTITFVGEVLQGPASNSSLPMGRSLAGSLVPQASSPNGALAIPGSAPGFPLPASQMFAYKNDGSGGGVYQSRTWDEIENKWDNEDYGDITVAEGFFIDQPSVTPWNRNFNVNP